MSLHPKYRWGKRHTRWAAIETALQERVRSGRHSRIGLGLWAEVEEKIRARRIIIGKFTGRPDESLFWQWARTP